MKSLFSLSLALTVFGAAAKAVADPVTYSFDNLNRNIPDGNDSGLADNHTVSGFVGPIADLNVTLHISGTGDGGYNGDLYVTLLHGDQSVVLLNRVGRRAGDLSGYSDAGFQITLDDQASLGDVHVYRMTLSLDHATPLTGPLTGDWAPDGRAIDPGLVLDDSARGSSLGQFNNLDANGEWTLFVADLEGGGTSQLQSWELSVTAATVPEPSSYLFAAGGLVTLLGISRLRKP